MYYETAVSMVACIGAAIGVKSGKRLATDLLLHFQYFFVIVLPIPTRRGLNTKIFDSESGQTNHFKMLIFTASLLHVQH